MPTAVIDLEVDQLATSIENLGRYEQALVLLRLQGRPIGQAYIPVVDGRIGAAALEAAFAEVDVYETWVHHVARHLDVHPYQPPLTATVAICTRDRPDDLRHCLDAVLRLPDDGQEILVIDNNPSTDATREVVAAYPKVRYVREDRRGLDNARNRALREARHDIVAFVDDDARPEPDWLRAILRNFDGPLVMCVTGLVMPVELETEAQEWFERYSRFGRGYRRRVFDYRNISPLDGGRVGAGASMALRRELIEEAGVKLIAEPEVFGFYSNHHVFRNDHVLLYRVRWGSWEPVKAQQIGEIAETAWVDPRAPIDGVTKGSLLRFKELYGGAPVSPYWTVRT